MGTWDKGVETEDCGEERGESEERKKKNEKNPRHPEDSPHTHPPQDRGRAGIRLHGTFMSGWEVEGFSFLVCPWHFHPTCSMWALHTCPLDLATSVAMGWGQPQWQVGNLPHLWV